jgi:formylglycine-generating enzyme required for sulfatase activity
MFDMLGNVWELCLTRYNLELGDEWRFERGERKFSEGRFRVEDIEDALDVTEGITEEARELRGGASLYTPSESRASRRNEYMRPYSSRMNPYVGFRIARTLPAE